MSSGAKQRLYIGTETERNVAATAFTAVKFTECNLDATPTRSESTAISESRISEGTNITGMEYVGDISVELSRTPIIKQLLEAVAFNSFALGKVAFGGETRKTFTIIRGNADGSFAGELGSFQQFTGCHISAVSLDVPIDGPVIATFSIMAMGRTPLTAAPAGATAAPYFPTITSVTVGEILLDGTPTAGVACVEAFTLSVDNSMQIQKCLGKKGQAGAIIETECVMTGSMTITWSAAAIRYYEKQFINGTVEVKFPLIDVENAGYEVHIPVGEIAIPLPSGGKSDILTSELAFTAVRSAITMEEIELDPEEP